MSIIIGPSSFWLRTKEAADFYAARCPVGTRLGDGSRIICKCGGCAWIVAPACTQVGQVWNNSSVCTGVVGNKCCVCDWPTLCARMISCGFNPSDWFVPSGGTGGQLNNPGYVCRTQWDFASANYWSSTEFSPTYAFLQSFTTGAIVCAITKSNSFCVRAFRCVTY